ncbi:MULTISPECIES: efflux RND transporter permease subunit [Muribaculaceae]|uniref:efflux RND transporter permease subunit n=5 Tax=Bacteroidales TaxID=171549 RepID=UPI00260690E3|nr:MULTISPECIES: efflux RND transporter permease subunit [Muribaculaceae]
MVRFLLDRPIAVVMAFLAAVIIGCVTYFSLPVSLLPTIDIPNITVQVTGGNNCARELENAVVGPLRRQLLQVGGLNEIRSETRDGMGVLRLHFDYGVSTDLAFIEVNEKIDATMSSLPREISRPKAIKASATDIPVLYLNMTLRDGSGDFLQMAEVAENVVRRRIEQMPQIAMADITGIPRRQLRIVPDRGKMESAAISVADIERALNDNNAEAGSMTVRDGYYEYRINVSTQLRTAEDVKNIFIRKAGRLMQLGDFCKVEVVDDNPQGYSYFNGKRAVTLAIIKQSEENMDKLKSALKETTDHFENLYPQIKFTQSRNQTELLDYTISNLVQNLILGFILVFTLTALFMGEIRSSMVIGISIMVSVVITFLLFYLFGVSINIISLSGLILAVGMMIDNSVIVTENIMQYRQQGLSLTKACDRGTSEMITPMLSSSLTTVAVFVPLVFISGIAGAIFFDQAFAITAGLAVSYITGIMLLPVIYRLFFSRSAPKVKTGNADRALAKGYTAVMDWCFAHKTVCLVFTALTLPACVLLFGILPVERMPQIDRDDMVARVEWNENINIDENARRVKEAVDALDSTKLTANSAYIGVQDYLLDAGNELSPSEAEIYLQASNPRELPGLKSGVQEWVADRFPQATVEFMPAENIFEKIFSTDEPDLEARLHRTDKSPDADIDALLALEKGITTDPTPMHDRLDIVVDREKLLLYHISYAEVAHALRTAFNANNAGVLRSYQQYLPITIASDNVTVENVLTHTMVRDVPLSYLVHIEHAKNLKSITAASDGEFIPLDFHDVEDPNQKMEEIKAAVERAPEWEVSFTGSIFSNMELMKELAVILLISVLMMYFILCAQFGSFVQPLIVLAEIPVDTAFALISLWLCGHSLNLMSAIGIIVTCGIVVNDSILKLDAINDLRSRGMPLTEAIHTAGLRRLRPIIMTSLTTILAMVPMLFTNDMGSELQQPLAIAMIGSMAVGTLVSIFVIPIVYWLIYRRDEKTTA